jgi:hypothetical protein
MSGERNKTKYPGYKRWVFIFLIVALLVHGGVFYLFTLDLTDPPDRENPEGFVVYRPELLPDEGGELEQRAYLFDSEPIFLPTTRNYSGPVKTDASVWEPEVSLSASFPPEIRWDDSRLLKGRVYSERQGDPIEFLNPISRDFVSEFSSNEPYVPQKSPDGLFVEIKNSAGETVLKTFVEDKGASKFDFPVNPAEFSILHTDYGLAGMPLLLNPSGSEDTDRFVREFILDKVHPLLVGTTGYFHLRIGL